MICTQGAASNYMAQHAVSFHLLAHITRIEAYRAFSQMIDTALRRHMIDSAPRRMTLMLQHTTVDTLFSGRIPRKSRHSTPVDLNYRHRHSAPPHVQTYIH